MSREIEVWADRWGRLLMQRREAALARGAERAAHRLQETDYLLGVHDEQRAGALRFKERETGDGWLSNDSSMRTPHILAGTRTRQLEDSGRVCKRRPSLSRMAQPLDRTGFVDRWRASESRSQGSRWRSLDREVSRTRRHPRHGRVGDACPPDRQCYEARWRKRSVSTAPQDR